MNRSARTADQTVGDNEADALFSGLEKLRGLILAVSGGPDSTALLILAARWAKLLKRPPKLVAVTIDHGLRAEAAREAAAVKRLARRLGVAHRTMRWRGVKPKAGLQEAARIARYRLLARAAARAGYAHILTAHTLDDQAETMLFRLARGSGLVGLGGIAYAAPLPVDGEKTTFLVRPLLRVPKARLAATLRAAGIAYSEDPSNRDPRFTRARLRTLMPRLALEGLDAQGFARLAARLRRADATIEFIVDAARDSLAPGPWPVGGPIVFGAARFASLPAEAALRLLGRAVAHAGNEGPVELAKLESLYAAMREAGSRLRRTLAGALITLDRERIVVECAPARQFSGGRSTSGHRTAAMRKNRKRSFTK
ncbi:MAG TPA: tRNA lysidine(34) synthetase TilS [Xanthobacteraceae bacterium]|nr:tRNA lysidine(34) synthetase TilS [Xanthobacteraceae bacterium]